MRCAFKALIGPDARANEGYYRPLTLKTSPNTLFDPRRPAATGLASWPNYMVIDRIHQALAQAVPDKLPAGYDMPCCLVFWGTDENGAFWADAVNPTGGQPAAGAYGDGGGPLTDRRRRGCGCSRPRCGRPRRR